MKKDATTDKILFVIPAYNEEKNLEKVLDEIEKDVRHADILVVNDCSSDNTEQILVKRKINHLNNIFNMGYGGAIQTGIKYAYENDYDYAIPMDADGQHIAKEAEKLYKYSKERGLDIVIGSRYLKDTGYHCPLFRRIGTKIFSAMIQIFCHQKIADPLSGFQCLDKDVIKRYAKMGGYPQDYPDANLIVEMLRSGYTIGEVPVKMRMREEGESMHGGIIKPIKYMVEIMYEIIFILLTVPKQQKGDK